MTRRRDCVARAISTACEISYDQACLLIEQHAARERVKRNGFRSHPQRGVKKQTTRKILASLGWEWVPTMGIGSGCKVHLRADELPRGRIIVLVSRHLVAVIDGQIHDIGDPTRSGKRCVYGYYRQIASEIGGGA